MTANGTSQVAAADIAHLRGALAALRWRYRVLDFSRGLALLVAVWGCLGGLALLLDMTLHLPAAIRWLAFGSLLAAAAAATAYVVGTVVLFPAGDRWLAVKVERRFPTLKNRLITSLQLAQQPQGPSGAEAEFLEVLLRQTREQMNGIEPARILPWRRLRVPLYVAVAGVLLVAGLRVAWKEGFEVTLRRLVTPSAAIEPATRTQVAVEPKGAAIARGDSLTLSAHIAGRLVEEVSLFIRRPGHDWTAIPMAAAVAEGSTEPATDFTCKLAELSQPIEYYVRAGDGETLRYRISILERPTVRRLALTFHYPEYLGLEPKAGEPGNYTIEAPVGTRVSLAIETEGEIVGGILKTTTAGAPEPVQTDLTLESATRARAELQVAASGSYALIVTNAAGLTQKEPAAYPLIAQPDTPPLVEVVDPGKDLFLNDRVKVPVLARARDDFGLRALYADVFPAAAEPLEALPAEPTGEPRGRKIAEVPSAGTVLFDAGFQVDLATQAELLQASRVSYVVYAVDRKGQVGRSKPLSISILPPEAQARPEPAAIEQDKRAAPQELAMLEELIEQQQQAIDQTQAAHTLVGDEQAPDTALPQAIKDAFEEQKAAAGQMKALRQFAAEQLQQISERPTAQDPYHRRALQAMSDLMGSLRANEVPRAMSALASAYRAGRVAEAGAQPAAAQAGQPSPQQAGQPSSQQAGQPSPQQAGQPQASQRQAAEQPLAAAQAEEQKALDKLQKMKEILEASLPGQVDLAKQEQFDEEIRSNVADFAGTVGENLRLAADKLDDVDQMLKPLIDQQEKLRGKTLDVDSEQVKNIAEPQDRLALDTGHADERMKQQAPFADLAQMTPEALQDQQPMDQAGAPRVPIPPVPAAPRKEVQEGVQVPMPPVQMSAPLAVPKMLIPDKFPDTFWGKLSDRPIPPPAAAAPTGRVPIPKLKKLTDEEKESLKETSLEALEIDDAINAMGLGAPAEEEMPEEFLLQPGAQYARGPSAPDSQPGMELGQSAGQIQPGPNQPSMGGGSEAPSSSSSQPSPSGQPKPGNQPGPPSPLSQAAGQMHQAAGALGQSDRAGALANQNDALGSLRLTKDQLARLRQALSELQSQMGRVDKTLSRPDVTQAEALAAVEGALNSPAWQAAQSSSLSPQAQGELSQLQQALQAASGALGGSQRGGRTAGAGRRAAELEGIEPSGLITVDAWAQFKLPDHLRQELLEGLREKGPEAYRQILEEYYRAIAEEK